MILAIDVGNTHISLGAISSRGLEGETLQLPTDPAETRFGYAVRMRQILELTGLAPDGFEGAVLASVVPPVTDAVKDAVQLAIGREPLCVGAGVRTGLHIVIDDPGTIAADLVAAAVAAKEQYPLPCIIVDMGTATTLSVVDEKGRYIGGSILPGAEISLRALAESTALLPRIEIQPPRKAIPSNTVDCMKAGVVWGTAGAIDGLLDRFSQALGREPASIVGTGGLAQLLCPACRHAITIDEALVLKGLGLIWKKNEEKRRPAGL